MKNKLIFLVVFFSIFSLEAESIKSVVDEKNCTYILNINSFNSSSTIATVYYGPENNQPIVGYEGTGFKTLYSYYEEKNDRIYIDCIYLWEGTETSNELDQRKLLYYKIILDKEKIFNYLINSSKSFIINDINLLYSPLVFEAIDLYSTVFDETFYVKNKCPLYDTIERNKKEILRINTETDFKIVGVCENEDSELFIRITTGDFTGFISFDNISGNWKILRNKLNKLIDINYFPATCNDNEVRLRISPSLDSDILFYLNKGDNLFIEDYSNQKLRIGTESWYWYKVVISDGTVGWVYGKYLNIAD